MEAAGAAGLLPAAFVQDATEHAVLDDEDLRATVRALPHGETDGAREIGYPLADVGVVFDQ